jgi:hypothetical protein
MAGNKTLTIKQKRRAIAEAIYDTQQTMSERKLYRWISTQFKHKHVGLTRAQSTWRYNYLIIIH